MCRESCPKTRCIQLKPTPSSSLLSLPYNRYWLSGRLIYKGLFKRRQRRAQLRYPLRTPGSAHCSWHSPCSQIIIIFCCFVLEHALRCFQVNALAKFWACYFVTGRLIVFFLFLFWDIILLSSFILV